MKLIANGLNKQYFESLLPPTGSEVDGVLAAIAYGDDRTKLLEHCLSNKYRLDIWMRYDHTVPVSPSLLTKFLNNINNNIFCYLIPDVLHSKVVWWRGYGAYIGSANLTQNAWYSNIETGLFLTESQLINSEIFDQLELLFDEFMSLDRSVFLTKEVIDNLKKLQSMKQQKEFKQQEQEYLLQKKRLIPKWEGVSFIGDKRTASKKKETFKQEWDSTITIMQNIASIIQEYRPVWIEESTPVFWQVDQFLHAYYYNQVRKYKKYPYEECHRQNCNNPQKSLLAALQLWESLKTPPSDEDKHLENDAPLIRQYLAKDRILSLSETELELVFKATHATMDHVIKISTDLLGKPALQYIDRDQRAQLFTHLILSKTNKRGESLIELIYFVLYGGKPELIWERLYTASKDSDYQFAHYGINSLAEVCGWARPEDPPPRNGRTAKALRALGYPVKIHI